MVYQKAKGERRYLGDLLKQLCVVKRGNQFPRSAKQVIEKQMHKEQINLAKSEKPTERVR